MKKYLPVFVLLSEFIFMFSLIGASLLFFSLIEDIKTIHHHSIWIKNNVNLYLPYYFLITSSIAGIFVYVLLKSESYNKTMKIDIANKYLKAEERKDQKAKDELIKQQKINAEMQVLSFKIEDSIKSLDQKENQDDYFEIVLKKLALNTEAVSGVFYLKSNLMFHSQSFFGAYENQDALAFSEEESILGSVAKSKEWLLVDNLNHHEVEVFSGLGKAAPKSYWIIPILQNNICKGVIELGLFKETSLLDQQYVKKMIDHINQKS